MAGNSEVDTGVESDTHGRRDEIQTCQGAPPLIHGTTLARNMEFNVVMFALLLNLPWEILQAPLFAGMADAPFADAIQGCARGTAGDAVILLLAYWTVSAIAGSRQWILDPSNGQLTLLVVPGVVVTLAIESLATRGYWVHTWGYARTMPVVPVIEVGITPLIQWGILPLLVAWFVRRQLADCKR